jgi:hypothetical protein
MPRFDRTEVVERARSRIGEASYRLFTNNCEHFCEWCIHGEARSRQVEVLRHAPRQLLGTLRRMIAHGVDRSLSNEPGAARWAI